MTTTTSKTTREASDAQGSPNLLWRGAPGLLTLTHFWAADQKHLLLTCRNFCHRLQSGEDSYYSRVSNILLQEQETILWREDEFILSPIQILSFLFLTFGFVGGLGARCPQLCTALRVVGNKVCFRCCVPLNSEGIRELQTAGFFSNLRTWFLSLKCLTRVCCRMG